MNKSSSLISRFIGNRAGVAAFEFAIVAPVLIVLFLGCCEVSDYVRATMRTDQVAQSVAALIARQTSLTNATTGAGSITDYCYAGQAVIRPYDPTKLVVKIASYTQSAGSPTKNWGVTCPPNDTSVATTGFTPGTPPAGLLVANGDSVIIVTASYNWVAPDGGLFGTSVRTASETAYARPRSNSTVTCTNMNTNC
jgi:Flp pilus assembly protein TadG